MKNKDIQKLHVGQIVQVKVNLGIGSQPVYRVKIDTIRERAFFGDYTMLFQTDSYGTKGKWSCRNERGMFNINEISTCKIVTHL